MEGVRYEPLLLRCEMIDSYATVVSATQRSRMPAFVVLTRSISKVFVYGDGADP